VRKLVLLLIGLIACTPPQAKVPMTLRPDTRKIVWVTLDTAVFRGMLETFDAALPNETVMCLDGEVSKIDTLEVLKVRVTKATLAIIDSSNDMTAYLPTEPVNGCETTKNLVGIAHDHVIPVRCEQSDPDANVLFVDKRMLFGLVFCLDGWTQILYQDGRRGLTRWR
jgi:hypothetical protein